VSNIESYIDIEILVWIEEKTHMCSQLVSL